MSLPSDGNRLGEGRVYELSCESRMLLMVITSTDCKSSVLVALTGEGKAERCRAGMQCILTERLGDADRLGESVRGGRGPAAVL